MIRKALASALRESAEAELRQYPDLVRNANDDGTRLSWDGLDKRSVLLYARPDRLLPHVSELLEFGPPALLQWQPSIGWDPSWGHAPKLNELSDAPAEYARRWRRELYDKREAPHLTWYLPKERTLALLGGWPVTFHENELREGRVLCTLFADEEPRRHVLLLDSGEFSIVDEIT